MRILFAGTPEIGVPALRELSSACEVCGVLTAPDKPSGRSRENVSSPVKETAISLNLDVLQPEKLDQDFFSRVKELLPDLLFVFAYGKIFKKEFIDLFPMGGINCHPSLLPLHRGPAPIPAAILGGDGETGITIQKLALRMDSGDILVQEKRILDGTETTESLTNDFAVQGGRMLVKAVEALNANPGMKTMPQDEAKATYCRLIAKENGRIDWSRPAVLLERMVRAYTPWPRAYTEWEGKTLAILKASVTEPEKNGESEGIGKVIGIDKDRGILINTGKGVLSVKELQLQAKKAMDWKAFCNGHRSFLGSNLKW
jgi:methionyl-tRNA formyltransferase